MGGWIGVNEHSLRDQLITATVPLELPCELLFLRGYAKTCLSFLV
jgi:hypothetical protein